jgi:hypothetical protein
VIAFISESAVGGRAGARSQRHAIIEKHCGHLAPSYVRDTVRVTAMELGMDEINIAPLPRRAL